MVGQQMTDYWEGYLLSKIKDHFTITNSEHAKQLIDNWEKEKFLFWQIIPKEMVNKFDKPVIVDETKIA